MNDEIKDTLEAFGLVKGAAGQSKAYELNPYDVEFTGSQTVGVLSDRHHGTVAGLSYDSLRALARMPLVSSIIQTRVNQIAEFARPQPDRYSAGFVIRTRNPQAELTDKIKAQVAAITEWLLKCGDPSIVGYTTFEAFLRAIVRDSLIFDQCCFEIVHRGGRPAAFKPVDAATIRRAMPTEEEKKQGKRNPKKTAFCQVIDYKVVAEFDEDQMAFGVRRPRNEIRTNGYGYPELEEAAPTIVDMIRAKAYNSANFTHGLHLSGILAVKSKMSPSLFRAFRREFYSMLQGGNGAKKTPIIQLDPEAKEEVSSVNLSNSNSDMEYSQWLNFLIKEVCALYQLDPAELGYVFGNEGNSNALITQGPEGRIIHSKERGLRPLLRAVETWINRWLIYPMASHLEFSFVGIDTETESQRIESISKKTKTYMTVNEARAAFDLDPLDNPIADFILDSSFINAAQMASQQGEEGEQGFDQEDDDFEDQENDDFEDQEALPDDDQEDEFEGEF